MPCATETGGTSIDRNCHLVDCKKIELATDGLFAIRSEFVSERPGCCGQWALS